MRNRITAAALAGVFFCLIMFANGSAVFASKNTIIISSAADYAAFAKKCTFDAWSKDKTVSLSCNLDFSKKTFLTVPTFCGTFNGNGYVISGITVDSKSSYTGVFRYIGEGGKVANLSVEAKITPDGSKSFVGGIVGENSGTVENCSFNGTVKGENVIGGIAGNNTDLGRIVSCIASGNVSGENFTGGIAGKNSGFIGDCINNASVNTVYVEKKRDISNIETDAGAIVESYKNTEDENEEESVLGHSDTGGITGYNCGIIEGCTNNAPIGYKHVGYNVGGIAGRQSGYMLGCKNMGFVQGRKDVGGIVGQAEPYILLNATEGGLKGIRQELGRLNTMINRLITDADGLGNDAEKHLNGISNYSKSAQKNTETLLNIGTDFVDDNLGEINAKSAILSNSLGKLSTAFGKIEDGGRDLSKALTDISGTLNDISINAPDLRKETDAIAAAISRIAKSEESLEKAAAKADRAMENLKNAVRINDSAKVQAAVRDLSAAIKNMINARRDISNDLGDIAEILQRPAGNISQILENMREIAQKITKLKTDVDASISALETISSSLSIIISNTEIDISQFRNAAVNMRAAIENLNDAMHYITSGLGDLSVAITKFSDKVYDYSNDVSQQLNKAKTELSDSLKTLSWAVEDINSAIKDIKEIVADLSKEQPLEFVKLGDDFRAASDGLFNAAAGISEELNSLRDVVSGKRTGIVNDLNSVNNQFNLVFNLIIGEVEGLQNGMTSISDRFLDVSDEDIGNTKQGKVADCHNFGRVEADRNTGGIAGAMAVEYSKDPEEDMEKPDSFNFTYRTKAILFACVNDGKVTGKKDCTGGIVGLSEIGTVMLCENYAGAESTNGNYVGGIAGKSKSTIRKSYAKSKVTGKRYVGGVAGEADTVTASYSISNADGEENIGAICGYASNKEKIYQNFFVDNGIGAVDGISYAEKAEPVDFETIRQTAGIPSRFISFTVSFIADGEVIKTQDIKYGDETSRIKYPDIPKKNGNFGTWHKVEAETVTEDIEVICDYKPYITVLSSTEKNQNGKLALALVKGEFTDKAELHVKGSKKTPPTSKLEKTKVYDVSILNTEIKDNQPVTIRMINENKDKVTAWVLENDKWKKVDTTKRGKYVMIQTKGTQNTICLKYEKTNSAILWVLLLIMAGGIAYGFVILKKRKEVTHGK